MLKLVGTDIQSKKDFLWLTYIYRYYINLITRFNPLNKIHHSVYFLVYVLTVCMFSFFIFPERNDQTEQEERREIKQRLNRKVQIRIYLEALVCDTYSKIKKTSTK